MIKQDTVNLFVLKREVAEAKRLLQKLGVRLQVIGSLIKQIDAPQIDATRGQRKRKRGRNEFSLGNFVEEDFKSPVDWITVGFPVNIVNIFEEAGITTFRQLVIKTPDELMKLRCFGPKRLENVEVILGGLGLWLGMTEKEIAFYLKLLRGKTNRAVEK